jgi:mevalonate kinase
MALKRRKYPSKLLLFGEYGVLLGLDALAIPYAEFSGRLEKTGNNIDENLSKLLIHLKKIKGSLPYVVNVDLFEKDINKGLIFNSEIPLNYGLGSSGALVAAVFENYFEPRDKNQRTDLRALKTTLALIESHFHGVSSGIDPLVSLLKQAILVRKSGRVFILDKKVLPARRRLNFFLLDSNIPGKTGDMVTQFMDKINETEFSDTFRSAYQKYSNGAISSLYDRDYPNFLRCYKGLSAFQINDMAELIPAKIQNYFQTGINTDAYYLKVCGSGGGGFFLGVTTNKEKVSQIINAPIMFL